MREIACCALVAILTAPGLALAGEVNIAAPELSLGPNFADSSNFAISNDPDAGSANFADHFGLRLGGQAFSIDLEPDYSAGRNSAASSFKAPDVRDAMLDFYPFHGSFRFSGGFLYDPDDTASGVAGQDGITIGGLPFTPSQDMPYTSTLDFGNYRPYAGVGLQSTFWRGRLEFALDFGLQFLTPSSPELGADGTPTSAAAAANEREIDEAGDQYELLGFSPRAGVSLKLKF